MSVPSGPGLAEERTAFAWRRTALSVAVGSLLCLRVLPPHLGPAGWALAVLGLCWSADLAWIGWRRQRDLGEPVEDGPSEVDPTPASVGADIVRTAVVTVVVGGVALVSAIFIAGRTLSP